MVQTFTRDEFIQTLWDYHDGEHVSFIEPTQQGKTYLMYQLLGQTMKDNPNSLYVSLMPKSLDPATSAWAQRLDMKVIDRWPPRKKFFNQDEPNGYVLWPRHIRGDIEGSRAHLRSEFRKCMDDQYHDGPSVTVADDVYLHAVLYDLNDMLEQHWTSGAGGGAGLWTANQKPSGTQGGGSVSSFSYNAPTHLFLGKDRDQRNIQRFGEIGGVDPKQVAYVVQDQLKMHSINGHSVSDKLYISKRGPYMCIVTP